MFPLTYDDGSNCSLVQFGMDLKQVAYWICLKDGVSCFLGKWMIPLTYDDVPNCSLVQFGMDLLNQVAFWICLKHGASCFFGQMDDPADL